VRVVFAKAILASLCLVPLCLAQEVDFHPPQQAVAGEPLSIPTTGSGDATFYLIGPGNVLKRTVQLGSAIDLRAQDISASGRYTVVLCTRMCRSEHFFVSPGRVSKLTFLAHPSRVAVGQHDAISGVVFPFDRFGNLVLATVNVNFRLSASHSTLMERSVATQMGVAWLRADSGSRGGIAQLTASVNDLSSDRVLQLVTADPCNLRIKAQTNSKGILVQTEPIHDCAGNAVPDGTIVTFSAKSPEGRSTVDAPVKKGMAQATLTTSGPTVITAASGVVMGNELRVDAKP